MFECSDARRTLLYAAASAGASAPATDLTLRSISLVSLGNGFLFFRVGRNRSNRNRTCIVQMTGAAPSSPSIRPMQRWTSPAAHIEELNRYMGNSGAQAPGSYQLDSAKAADFHPADTPKQEGKNSKTAYDELLKPQTNAYYYQGPPANGITQAEQTDILEATSQAYLKQDADSSNLMRGTTNT
jgi:hypothetical protein